MAHLHFMSLEVQEFNKFLWSFQVLKIIFAFVIVLTFFGLKWTSMFYQMFDYFTSFI
jgi:hypothetical protein